ncbi:MAG: PEGA domain-containing protein, partial [Gallionellaceae bacterium]|nr:PEGA domain-containing protein [Gallionellaceae bacterium]
LVKDINGQPNIVGDGINVAQRVMGFADPGQILVSRSYYDAVSRLSQEYAGMFHYQGSRTDKHVREHEVYAIGYPGDFTSTQQSLSRQNRQENASGLELIKYKLDDYWGRLAALTEPWERRALDFYRRISDKQRAVLWAGLAVVAVSLFALLINLWIGHATRAPQVSQAQSVSPVKLPSATVAARPSDNEKPTGETVSEPAAEPAPARVEKKVQGVKESARVRTLIETTGAPAVVGLMVQPWGEIYLDGRLQGVSPPLMELQVVAGKHEIKIKNTTFPAYTEVIRVKSGEKIKIKHKFAD